MENKPIPDKGVPQGPLRQWGKEWVTHPEWQRRYREWLMMQGRVLKEDNTTKEPNEP